MHSSPPTQEPTATPVKTRRWGVVLLWCTPALFLLVFVGYGFLTRPLSHTDSTVPRVGTRIADFVLPDLHGRVVQLAALRGKVVFINVWATWCPPCVEEMPTIQRLHQQLHQRGLEVLTVGVDALGAQVVAPFVHKYQLTFPVLLDPTSTIERLYRMSGVPESFIVDKQGRLVEKIIGPRDWAHPHMLSIFERLLAAPATP